MNNATQTSQAEFVIGTKVLCDDGDPGQLKRVVIDPIARAITHLVVEPAHRQGAGHLVPIGLVVSASEAEIALSCSESAFAKLEPAEDVHFYPGGSGAWNYQQSQMMTSPYYAMGMGMGGVGMGTMPSPVTTDRVPIGDVQVHRGEHVHASDGPIGHVQGLVVDPSDHCVTHVLLDEGHLWGKKRVGIPISAVSGVSDGVRLTLSKQEVEDLPEVSVADFG